MPSFTPYTLSQLDIVLKQIERAIYTPVADLSITAWRTKEPVPYADRESGQRLDLKLGDRWGELFDAAWFRFTGQVPEAAAGQPVVLLIDVNGELCVVDDAGLPVRGLTNVASEFDLSLGMPGKHVLPLTPAAQGGEDVDVWADGGCNDLFGFVQQEGVIREACIAVEHRVVRDLFYDYEVLLDFLKVLPVDGARYQQVLTALHDAAWKLAPAIPDATAQAARECLAPMLAQRGGDPSLSVSAIGHAHIDLGWLWPIRETKRKGVRTFATALANLALYPDYIYGASQPQLYQWMKEEQPVLYARIREAVAAGRIEPLGAMWVEPDTSMPSGEALARQLLLGKRFFRQEFGADVRHLWLPDTFGYSAALPQLLQLADVDTFMTQKLSWNQVNRFPHHAFHWQGIDGSRVLAYLLPEETYNGPAAPRAAAKIERNYQEKCISDQGLMVFGIGDGGGGPGEEHLERLARIRNLAGLPPVQQEHAAAFFARWAKDAARFPAWVGELYLERHSGTLTTQGRNKWYNRRMEQLLREVEWLALLAGGDYPSAWLESTWREVLLYQFHDILPGSSIKRVYDESLARYAAFHGEAEALIRQYQAEIAGQVDTTGMAAPHLVFNALSWPRTEWVEAGGRWRQVTVPPLGYVVVDLAAGAAPAGVLSASPERLENDRLRVDFAPDGTVATVYDKTLGRSVLAPEGLGNRLAVYHDPGDAWDFPLDYADQVPAAPTLVSAEASVEGARAKLVQRYVIGASEIEQTIVLTAGSARLDFATRIRWRERATMLRTSFALAVRSDEAVYEIQFGHIRRPTHRNTTWDLARDEVAAHRWVDMAQRDFGVALLNDGKYGHKVKGNVIDLNLLRSVPHPGSRVVRDEDVAPGEPHGHYTDQCEHAFTYAIFPHAGDFLAGEVLQAAHGLNLPLRVVPLAARSSGTGASYAMLTIDAPNVIVEAVKRAEDDDDIVVRLYEAGGASTQAVLRPGFAVQAAAETNLLEEAPVPLSIEDGAVALSFRPLEIKTVRLRR